VRAQFPRIYRFLVNKWWFDELYDNLFVKPVHVVSRAVANFDKLVIDRLIDALARGIRTIATFDDLIDRYVVDGLVNIAAGWIYSFGLTIRGIQTGRLREYVMYIVIGTVALFVLASFALRYAVAG
jgi:NADH-quinone oxidoreductase subunit L